MRQITVRRARLAFLVLWTLIGLMGLTRIVRAEGRVDPTTAATNETVGYASWYAGKFQGRLTASGEVFDTNLFTAAHKTLPFGTIVEVEHLGSGRRVRVRINDRGPFVEGRIIDLSRAAAEALGMTAQGIARVRVSVVAEPGPEVRRIQIASFASEANALRTRDRIRAGGVPAGIEVSGSLYRVVVPGLTEAEVAAVRESLARLGYPDVLVRSENGAPDSGDR